MSTTQAPPEPSQQQSPQPTTQQPGVEPLVVAPFSNPPILLRSTYPPGQPNLGTAPKPLRHTPKSIQEIAYPGSLLGTLFQGPLMSGPAPGIQAAVGSGRLVLCLQVDWSMGNFQLAIPFPGGSFVESVNTICYEAGLPLPANFAPAITIGTQAGQGDIATAPQTALGAVGVPAPAVAQLPLWNAVSPVQPFVGWINVSGNTGPPAPTAGGYIVLINYLRITPPWSAPAINWNRPNQ